MSVTQSWFRPRSGELAAHEVGDGHRRRNPLRSSPQRQSRQAGAAHQQRHRVVADGHALGVDEFCLYSQRAVGFVRGLVDCGDAMPGWKQGQERKGGGRLPTRRAV